MTTKLVTGGIILVGAIIFGVIFWNQFHTNQQQLAGNSPTQADTQTQVIPKNDSAASIEADLDAESSDINSVDSESSGLSTQLNGF